MPQCDSVDWLLLALKVEDGDQEPRKAGRNWKRQENGFFPGISRKKIKMKAWGCLHFNPVRSVWTSDSPNHRIITLCCLYGPKLVVTGYSSHRKLIEKP